MTASAALPFSPTTDSLAVWLEALAPLPPANAAHQLNHALRLLKDSDIQADQLLPLLVNLTPLTLYLSNNLSAMMLAGQEPKLNAKSIKVAKLGIQLLRQLSLAFCRLAESGQLDARQIQQSIFYALQLIGYSLRNCALLYEMPSATLWKKSAVLYRLAVKTDSLHQPQVAKLQEFKLQATIAEVLQRNLLFSIFMPTLYQAPEISHLFLLANQYFELLSVSEDQIRDCDFYWNLEGGEPCVVRRVSKYLPSGFLAINCRRFAHGLQLGTIKSTLKPLVQAKLALHLSAYKQVYSSTMVGPSSVMQMLVGFDSVGHYLSEQDKLAKIRQLGGESPDTRFSAMRNMTLMPLEHEKNYLEMRNSPENAPLPGRAVNLQRTASKLYVVAESRPGDCESGDIVLLYKQQHQPMLAISRQLAIHEISGATLVLLEYIQGSCSIHTFTTSEGDSKYVIVVGETSPQPQVFLPSGKYSVDSKIEVSGGGTLHLNACLEYGAYFARFSADFEA